MANQLAGKAPSDSPALKPYRGKPAVRNFRGGNGNVGIIQSPVRAIALPDSRLYVRALRLVGRTLSAEHTCLASVNIHSIGWIGSGILTRLNCFTREIRNRFRCTVVFTNA